MTRLEGSLPDKLTITLWDFSWYVRTGPGEPFEDLDRAFREAVQRGYNTVRICAMPFLLFRSGLDTTALELEPLGGGLGQRTRWYDVKGATTIDARAHLLELFRAAARHDCYVIVSSWEYQQSPAFASTDAWHRALQAVHPEQRAEVLAHAHADLVDLLMIEGLDDRVAFCEIHNEVQISHLGADLASAEGDRVIALRPRLERALAAFRSRHPQRPVTVNYAGVPVGAFRGVPDDLDVLVVHPYVYGVLDDLIGTFGLRRPVEEFPQARAERELLRPGAPPATQWRLPAQAEWRQAATVMSLAEVYVHDWADGAAFDRWLYDHYGEHRLAMHQKLQLWLAAAADWAAAHNVPLVLGEGWVGYTPLAGQFEEGPVGAELCRFAVRTAAELGAWGSVVCSNAAPHHPMWSDVALQLECNEIFTAGTPGSPEPVTATTTGAPGGAEEDK